ncbi:MAG: fibronectin type III domain-containing protein [Acidobacteria bacterium]|nr:fibronectin type III domain-containing protein [Acidobacteriota bacterium]
MRHLIRTAAILLLVTSASVQAAPEPTRLEARVSGSQIRFTWDAADEPVTGYRLEAGLTPGASDLPPFSVPGSALGFNLSSAPAGTYYVRVRAVAPEGMSAPSNEVRVVVGACAAPPAAPASISASAVGTVASLTWAAASGATSYVLEAGTTPAHADVFTGNLGSALAVQASVEPGTYFARVRARNACGLSAPSPEAVFAAGSPDAPTTLTGAALGGTVTLSWVPPGRALTGYLVDVGTAPGASNLGSIPVAGTSTSLIANTVTAGTYYVRVRAVGPSGASSPSNEVTVVVSPASLTTTTVGFDDFTINNEPVEEHVEDGIVVRAVRGAWQQRTIYGNPLPYFGFTRLGTSINATASIEIAAEDAGAFQLGSFDLYSSVTTIPVALTGMLGSRIVYSGNATLPATRGQFVRVVNPYAGVIVDRVILTLDNDYSGNPFGVDNIVIRR